MQTFFKTIPRLANVFAVPLTLCWFIILFQLYVVLFSSRLCKYTFNTKIRTCRKPYEFHLHIATYSDLCALKEVFVDGEYNWFPINEMQFVVDLGAYIGDATLFYISHLPKAKIISVEPDSGSYLRLQANVAGKGTVIPVCAAIGATDETVSFFSVANSLGNSVHNKDMGFKQEVVQTTLSTLFANYGVVKADLIKFDIEGGEFALFDSINPADYASAYIGEVHEDLGGASVESLQEKFSQDFQVSITPTGKKGRYIFKALHKTYAEDLLK